MAQIVINISDGTYNRCKNERVGLLPFDIPEVYDAIKNGTPLPKGHGRIGDLDALRCENADFDTYNDYCTMFDEIEAAEAIIEADKEDEDADSN